MARGPVGGRSLLIAAVVVILGLVGAAVAMSGDDSDDDRASETSETTGGKATSTTAAATPPAAPGEAEIARAEVRLTCVHHGEEQTITIEGHPGTRFIYQAVYGKGENEMSGLHPEYAGGNKQGSIGADGTYSGAWTVKASAPAGEARVDVYDTVNTAEIGGPAVVVKFEVQPPGTECEGVSAA